MQHAISNRFVYFALFGKKQARNTEGILNSSFGFFLRNRIRSVYDGTLADFKLKFVDRCWKRARSRQQAVAVSAFYNFPRLAIKFMFVLCFLVIWATY